MIKITSFLETIKHNNQTFGIVICVIITFISYAINPTWFGFMLFRDFDLSLGLFFGLFLALRFRNENQSPLKFGITTGLISGSVSSIAPGFLMWYLFGGGIIVLLINISVLLVTGLILGFIIGGLLGWYYMSKDTVQKEEKEYDDDFFEELMEK